MNIENLNERADYLDRGDFGGKEFNMAVYDTCVIGHSGTARSNIDYDVAGVISLEVFGISPDDNDVWFFAYGCTWSNDAKAAADRLRYLARHGGVPNPSVWHTFNTHPQPVVEIEESETEPELVMAL